ncbi:MAG TPA: substrate-binding domain-containing protein [Rhizomicrobium sp.]|jgi:ABC-type phosphate transport system substrate-binding protein|nr:substrate-binding domain-containing protein [Rhizomicrobium sp.]
MQKLNHILLASACVALLGAAGLASSATAATNCYGDTNCSLGTQPYTFGANDLFGGGSSLIAPYWRQEGDCYGNPADLITKGTPPTFVDENFYDGKGQDCATKHVNTSTTSWYVSTGSGSGILGVFTHDPISYWGVVNEAKGDQYFPYVSFADSDAGLGSYDVDSYNQGNTSYCQGSTCVNIAAPGGLPCGQEQNSQYPNSLQCYGPLVQFPASIDPVAIIYTNGGTYEKVIGSGNKYPEIDYHLNVQNANKYGGLRLSVNSLCGIYNGEITNWNDPDLTADNGGASLEDPTDPTPSASWSVTLIPVARSDSSGTTSIQTRHLANVCASFTLLNGKTPTNYYTTGATTIQAAGASAIVGNTYNVNNPNFPGVDQPGYITLAPNSSGVAQYTAFTQSPAGEGKTYCSSGTVLPAGYNACIQQGRVGYDGADYVLPYVENSQTNDYDLFSAALQNYHGDWVTVSPATALIAFGSAQPPQTSSKGKYCATCTDFGMRNDPTAWVEGLSPTEPLANPTEAGAYPDVGTTDFDSYTCYLNATTLANLEGLINWRETSKATTSKKGVLGEAGLSPLPKQWTKAIDDAFYTNKDKLNLQPSVVAKSGTTPACETVYNNGGGA